MQRYAQVPLAEVLAMLLYAALLAFPTELTVEGEYVSFFWPASGVAFAIAARMGLRALVFLLLANATDLYLLTGNAPAAVLAAVGLVLEARVGAWLYVVVLGGDLALRRRADFFRFVGAAGLIAPGIGATIGTFAWCLGGEVPWERAQTAWICWWYGECLGLLFTGPMLLGGVRALWGDISSRQIESVVVALGTLIVTSAAFFASPNLSGIFRAPMALLPLPFLYWGASRIGLRYTSLILTVFGGVVTLGTLYGYGPFGNVSTAAGIVSLWTYGQLVALSALLMGSLLSERDDALTALRNSEVKFRNLVELGPSVVYSFPHEDITRFSYMSPQAEAVFGYPPVEFQGNPALFPSLIHPDDLPRVAGEIQQAWEQHVPMIMEYRVIRRDGALRWVRDEARYFPPTGQGPASWQGVIVDVTPHREVVEAHRKSQELLEGIWNASAAAMFVLDTRGQVIMANPAAQRLAGATVGAMHNGPLFSFVDDDGAQLPESELPFRIVLETGSAMAGATYRVGGCRGGDRWLSIDGAPLRDAEGALAGAFFIVEDITAARAAAEQRESLESQLRHAQKMEAVGQLAGGVAHDFNNLLQVILGYTRLAMEERAEPAARMAHLRSVQEAAGRAAQLTAQLLAYGRRQALSKDDCDLNSLVREHLSLVERLLGEHIEIVFRPGEDLWNVHVDRSQVEQVVLNLCLNARDAMPGGGTLTLSLANTEIGAGFVREHPWARTGSFVALSVSDTGHGMDDATQSRIFEPFFTTKPQGQGTGLGLSVVHGIVEQHGGMLEVRSVLGEGTEFRVYFPSVARRRPAPEPRVAEATAERELAPVLLLAEDDPAVRDIARLLLKRAGYEVMVAEDGAAAVRLFEANSERVQMLVLDVVMPGMGGIEAHARINALRPGIPTLFCSGYSGIVTDGPGDLPSGTHFLAKPYNYERLVEKLRTVAGQTA